MAEHDTSADADLQLKKRARRRLVGAIALALLAVIVLPMVMDREPRPAGQDIQVRIPSQDAGGLAAKVLPAKPVATPMPAPEPKSVAEPVPGAQPRGDSAAPATSTAEPAKPKPDAAKPELVTPPAKPAAAPAKPAAVAAATAKPPPKAAPEVKPAVEKAPPNPQGANAKKAVEAKSAAADGQWVVQLGAFRDGGNVKLLMSKLKELKLPAYTEKYDSPQGPRTRVRAGPFPSREAAEKARERIKIIGVDGSVAQK